jgi:quercetin dioxygenase-like cupin family protein
MMPQQTFIKTNEQSWIDFTQCPGTQILPLAEPVPHGSLHRLKLKAGTTIPIHTHPCDEYVYVFSGTIKTGETECEAGTFWFTPAHTRQGPHHAVTDVELFTLRLGAMGTFEVEAL